MGSVGITTGRYESVRGLIFGIANIRTDYIDIDGYSNKKTEKGMLNELARALTPYDKNEADVIRSMIANDEIYQMKSRRDEPGPQYILEWELVPSASRDVDKDGKDTILSGKEADDVEYKDANYYVHVRIIR